MTTEQKLQAIINAQIAGGFIRYMVCLTEMGAGPPEMNHTGRVDTHTAINQNISCIEILLDPQGLKAAYGGKEEPAYHILDIWLLSNGDAEKTIDTAYQLLPR